MKVGTAIRIPDHQHKDKGKTVIQPGLPGRWSIWSQADAGPGAHFAIPLDDEARAAGVTWATVRVTDTAWDGKLVVLLATSPADAMPALRRVVGS